MVDIYDFGNISRCIVLCKNFGSLIQISLKSEDTVNDKSVCVEVIAWWQAISWTMMAQLKPVHWCIYHSDLISWYILLSVQKQKAYHGHFLHQIADTIGCIYLNENIALMISEYFSLPSDSVIIGLGNDLVLNSLAPERFEWNFR